MFSENTNVKKTNKSTVYWRNKNSWGDTAVDKYHLSPFSFKYKKLECHDMTFSWNVLWFDFKDHIIEFLKNKLKRDIAGV